MHQSAVYPPKIQRLLDAARDASDTLVETVRETTKGEHPGQWRTFGGIIDIRETLANQLQAVADADTKLKKATGRETGPASWELLRIARNVYWFVEHLDVAALPSILDADLNELQTRNRLAGKLSVEPEWSDILKKLSTAVYDPKKPEIEETLPECGLDWQAKLAERASEIDAQLDDLADRIEAEFDAIAIDFRRGSRNVSLLQKIYRHDKDSFSLDGVNQFNVPPSVSNLLGVFAEQKKSLTEPKLRNLADEVNVSQAMKRLFDWNSGFLRSAVRLPSGKGSGYFIHVVDAKEC